MATLDLMEQMMGRLGAMIAEQVAAAVQRTREAKSEEDKDDREPRNREAKLNENSYKRNWKNSRVANSHAMNGSTTPRSLPERPTQKSVPRSRTVQQ